MPTVTLLKPARLNTLGRIFERGVEQEVDIETARLCYGNPRFRVEGLIEAIEAKANSEASVDKPERPATKEALYEAIRAAADQLDADDESNFTATGKPQVSALEKILGYDISADERDHAITSAASKGKIEEGEDRRERRGGVKIISKKKTEDDKGTDDPTTSGAVEV